MKNSHGMMDMHSAHINGGDVSTGNTMEVEMDEELNGHIIMHDIRKRDT